jgi:hypothetical protein
LIDLEAGDDGKTLLGSMDEVPARASPHKRLDIAALFGVEGIESERAFAGASDAGEDDELTRFEDWLSSRSGSAALQGSAAPPATVVSLLPLALHRPSLPTAAQITNWADQGVSCTIESAFMSGSEFFMNGLDGCPSYSGNSGRPHQGAK